MKLLKDYQNLRNQIFDYFGYKEDWVVIPFDDETDCVWSLEGEVSGVVRFGKTEREFCNESGQYFEEEICTNDELSKWVYRGKDYTMIVVDTRTFSSNLFMIFSNAKEIKSTDKQD